MLKVIAKLKEIYPDLRFVASNQFSWSPESREIFYNKNLDNKQSTWSLLHETGHAILGHTSYKADVELLRLEVEAWEKARSLAAKVGITIDDDHIQDCLDTYRDWLYKRCICPKCNAKCLQQGDFMHYRCFNCHTIWRVSASRFCRAYRSTKKVPQATAFNLEAELQ